uniref:Uncharacterized protein n=1 Tax=Xiphophorus maculatus TaxID=8083 RepID=A0A3B5Q8B2_XIPMA
MSIIIFTVITTSIVPDICGSPPSTAVSTRFIFSCFSLSKGFFSVCSFYCKYRKSWSVVFYNVGLI